MVSMSDLSHKQRSLLFARSDGFCEAMVLTVYNHVWTRCWGKPIEYHHLLTKARGGRLLDEVNEIYHLVGLCHQHHAGADGKPAYEAGLLIDGYVQRNNRGRPTYTGTNAYLKEHYP